MHYSSLMIECVRFVASFRFLLLVSLRLKNFYLLIRCANRSTFPMMFEMYTRLFAVSWQCAIPLERMSFQRDGI